MENNKNTTNGNAMNSHNSDTLVTLAIHTFEKAQILKTLLENAGIEAYIMNVNQLLPNVSAGVRVKIKETDLARALDLIEETNWGKDDVYSELNNVDNLAKEKSFKRAEEYVLIPVDFSEYTEKIVNIGFNFAKRRGLSVLIIHAYFSQYYSVAPMVIGDITGYQAGQELNLRREYEKATKKIEELKRDIKEKIAQGSLPDIQFDAIVRDGAPEDLILSTAKQMPPVAIVMGTRGKSRRHDDLIGSVAAEVIDSAKVPVLVVPEETPVDDLIKIENIGVATSFDQRDLVLFDRMMFLFKPLSPHYKLFNISRSTQEWGEIELAAMAEYHKQHYPGNVITFSRLDDGDFSQALQDFIKREEIGLIVVNTYRRNLFARFFNPGMARRMLFHAGTPLLVMHSNSWR